MLVAGLFGLMILGFFSSLESESSRKQRNKYYQEEQEKMLDAHDFIEAKFVHGTVYGTGVAEIQAIHDAGRIAITDIDVQGVDEYKNLSQTVFYYRQIMTNGAAGCRRVMRVLRNLKPNGRNVSRALSKS